MQQELNKRINTVNSNMSTIVIESVAEELLTRRFATEEQYREYALDAVAANRNVSAKKIFEVFSQYISMHPYDKTSKQLNEHLIDRFVHPKFGEMFWDNSKGTHSIQRNNRTSFLGTREEVAKRWQELKVSAKDASSQNVQESEYDDAEPTQKSARTVDKPSAPDFSWISGFDIKEIAKAIDVIVNYLTANEDQEQVNVLRNDIRILDNLAAAMRSKDGHKISKCWTICTNQGTVDHLHDEFVEKMNDTVGKRTTTTEGLLFGTLSRWTTDATSKGFKVLDESYGHFSAKNTHGEMVGMWTVNSGWLYEQKVSENTPPGEEMWVRSNKKEFVDKYGEEKGTSILYATAWKRYNKGHQPAPKKQQPAAS